jgi:tRNA(Arg) A34 adenosine deaminase TadA
MCASAIRWAGFKEYIYGTTIDHLVKSGWGQILISSEDVVAASWPMGTGVKVMGCVGTEFTDGLFEWQFQGDVRCPSGCARTNSTGGTTTCSKTTS